MRKRVKCFAKHDYITHLLNIFIDADRNDHDTKVTVIMLLSGSFLVGLCLDEDHGAENKLGNSSGKRTTSSPEARSFSQFEMN
jgi:hypothetical protein